MLKDMQSHSPRQTIGQITGAEFQIKQVQKDRNTDSQHSLRETRSPGIPPVAHTDFLDTAHNQTPCTLWRKTLYQVHHTWEAGNRKSFLAGINWRGKKKKVHMLTTERVYVIVWFGFYIFLYKHGLNQISLSPAVALWDSNPPILNRADFVLLSRWHQAGESCVPCWSPVCDRKERFMFQDVENVKVYR